MHKSQVLFVILLSFIFGVGAGSWLAFSQATLYLFFIPPLILIGVFWRKNWKIVFGAFLAAVFLFGVLRTFDFRLSTTFVQKFADGSFNSTLSGYVDSEVRHDSQNQQFVFRVKKLAVPGFTVPEKLNEKVLISVPVYPYYKYGDRLSLNGKISLPKNYSDFDYISYLAKDQIYTIMVKPEVGSFELKLGWLEKAEVSLFANIFKLKDNFENAIGRSVTEPQASFINGILLGSRQDIPADLKKDFATSGVSHVLAISGYNISIVALVISWLLLFFFRRSIAFWFSLIAIALFTILTGASASVVRSALMGGLVLFANNSGRLYNSKNALTLAAFLMIFANPMILRFDVGFQLSFFATLGIIYLAPLINGYFSARGGSALGGKKLPDWFNFKEIFLMTLSAQIMVLPLLLFYFHNFSLTALPANLIILPMIPLAMALGFFTGMAGMIWSGLGIFVGAASWLVTSLILVLIKFFAHIPFSSWQIYLPWYGAIIFYALIFYLWFYLWKKQSKKAAE